MSAPAHRGPRRGRWLATAATWALGSATVALVLSLAAPRLLGGGSYAVVSGSMAGSVETGDLVIALPRPARQIRPGQIVAFLDPEGTGRRLQHRVQRVARRGGELEVTTMGDANSGYERWRVPADGEVDRVVTRLSGAGYLVGPITTPIARAAIGSLSAMVLLAIALVAIWRRPPEVGALR